MIRVRVPRRHFYLHVVEASVVVLHHLRLSPVPDSLYWPHSPDHCRRMYLGGPDGLEDPGRRHAPDHVLRLAVDHHDLLVDVLHVGLEVGLLLELFRTNVARVFVVALTMDANHVSAQTALALELLEADVTVKSRSVMLGLHVHVSAAG